MREFVIARIQEMWADGYDEFQQWHISTFESNCDGSIQYKGKRFQRHHDIKEVLDDCSDVELLACLTGQHCQQYR